MARSLRFIAFEFEPSKYDAMLWDVNNLDNNTLAAVTGLSSVRAVWTLENRMMVMSNYDSMEELDAATDAHRSIFAGIGQYMNGQPLVRSGEIVIQVDGKNPISNVGYMRFTRIIFDPSKYDALKNCLDNVTNPTFQDIACFSAIRGARLREGSNEGKPAMLVAAAYENEASATAAITKNTRTQLGKLAEFLTEEPLIRQGDLVWQYRTSEDTRLRG